MYIHTYTVYPFISPTGNGAVTTPGFFIIFFSLPKQIIHTRQVASFGTLHSYEKNSVWFFFGKNVHLLKERKHNLFYGSFPSWALSFLSQPFSRSTLKTFFREGCGQNVCTWGFQGEIDLLNYVSEHRSKLDGNKAFEVGDVILKKTRGKKKQNSRLVMKRWKINKWYFWLPVNAQLKLKFFRERVYL